MLNDSERMQMQTAPDAPDSNVDPLVGTVLLKRYEVLEQVGTGRFSVVYKARQLLMNRIVAIKSLKRDLLDEKEVVARFKKEARALSRLRHPNIVAVFDCFESQNGRPFIVMDYLDGMSLEDLLAKDHCLTSEMAKPIFLQVCDALGHAHKQGVLHRDLKPGNMVLMAETKGGELVQLVDFGLAQVEEEVQKLTQDGECCGSPAYMSPEHCTGEPLDGRSDIYSVGVVMYETLTGVVPFKGRTSVETMRLQVYESPPSFKVVRPDLAIPWDVEETVLRCLYKEPEKRFQNTSQLKEAVQNWCKPGAPMAPPPPPPEPETKEDHSKDSLGPSKAKEWTAAAASSKQREPQIVPQTKKLKKWTNTQQKANALRVPIVVACFVAAVGLAVIATLFLAHKGGDATISGASHFSSSGADAEESRLGASTTVAALPLDTEPPSTLPTMAAMLPVTRIPVTPAPSASHPTLSTVRKPAAPSQESVNSAIGGETPPTAVDSSVPVSVPAKPQPALKAAVPAIATPPALPVQKPVAPAVAPVKPAVAPASKPTAEVPAKPVSKPSSSASASIPDFFAKPKPAAKPETKKPPEAAKPAQPKPAAVAKPAAPAAKPAAPAPKPPAAKPAAPKPAAAKPAAHKAAKAEPKAHAKPAAPAKKAHAPAAKPAAKPSAPAPAAIEPIAPSSSHGHRRAYQTY